MSRYVSFDRTQLVLEPLGRRRHDFSLAETVPLDGGDLLDEPALARVAERIVAARANHRAVILAMGAHVLKVGVGGHVIDLVERGWITHLACNGAAVVHDFELALVGATTESVARYVSQGQFGLWQETGRINDIVCRAAQEGLGLGEGIGREIAEGEYPYRQHSLFAAAYRRGVPATVHVGIGYDIVHEHPNCDGAAWGATSYRDFLILAESIRQLEGGVFMSLGSAVMAPEVYLKALAMARNVAHQTGQSIRHFTTLVCDLVPLRGDVRREAPRSDPQYYYRPYKTILVRTVADGGESFYVAADHRQTIPTLRQHILQRAP